jgi:DNA helicase-2/ATP-dependent DNA helicase PcrA
LAAGAIANILQYLSDPKSPKRLARVYQVWRRADREDEKLSARLQQVTGLIEKIPFVEDFITPAHGRDWLTSLVHDGYPDGLIAHLEEFRGIVRRWQGAVLLPIDQLVLTLAQDLFNNSTELAIAHKLAVILGRNLRDHPDWRLPEMTGELAVIAKNERRFLGFNEDDLGFDPEQYKGRVVVATMHKSKGLEWDRVYLMSVNNYDYPSGEVYDRFISEKDFIRDGLNLQAEALAELETLTKTKRAGHYQEGAATDESRDNYVRERLRLLYVGITRAKQELVVTWNTGRKGELQPAIALVALQAFARERGYGNE